MGRSVCAFLGAAVPLSVPAGNAGVCGRSTGGAWRAAALAAAAVSPPWVQRPLSLWPASVRSWAGGGGGEEGAPWSPDAGP